MTWQNELKTGFKSARALLGYLNIPPDSASIDAEQIFSTRVPLSFAERMKPGNLNDPLLRQVLAMPEEMYDAPADYSPDPLNEARFNPIPGLIHKYLGRVLLILTGACAVNCRYCFRRLFPYEKNNPGQQGWQRAIDYIQSDSSIHEVILSGGDPLMLPDMMLEKLFRRLALISHVQTIRIHTRMPIVLPSRITEGFMNCIKSYDERFRFVVVLHVNHPNELNDAVKSACKSMSEMNITLLNQSVILKKINNDVDVLTELSLKLWQFGIIPYYLHLLDKVSGVAHFDIQTKDVMRIYDDLACQLPGYLLPKLVKEISGKPHKTYMKSISE